MREHSISVKQLAEFVHQRGDLYQPGGRVSAEEGTSVHSALQKLRKEAGYRCEHSVEAKRSVADQILIIRGRADVVGAGFVEELKTTRLPMLEAQTQHTAQAMLYAALLTNDHSEHWTARVTYVHPDTLFERSFDTTCSAVELQQFLGETLATFGGWLADLAAHRRELGMWTQALRFPFSQPRPYQHALVQRVAQALKHAEGLLLEAPTGSGKTVAVLYPAVHRLANFRRIWFLTSRGTGQAAGMAALSTITGDEPRLRVCQLTAKEKICPVEGQPCDPELCEYARGYYDRRHDAVANLLALRTMDASRVLEVAHRHTVCPFELSLDAALWADVVIGDYNYVFDPVVRLQRFAEENDALLLIDEAHQLAPRTADMLSFELRRSVLQAALPEAPKAIASRIRSIDRALTDLRRETPACREGEVEIETPQRLFDRATKFTQAVQEWAQQQPAWRASAALQQAFFECARWARGGGWTAQGTFLFTLDAGSPREIAARCVCIDPAPYITSVLNGFGANIRFSATVSPPELYLTAHGTPADAFARAGSPFSIAQMVTHVVTDVPTYYQQRRQSLGQLARLVEDVVAAKPGRYLVCFPSYAYLAQFAEAFAQAFRGELLLQEPGMLEAEQAGFLTALGNRTGTTVAAVVLGGIFTESVDLNDVPLTGVIVVGAALPPPSTVRDAVVRHHDEQGRDGRLIAFVQPAMARVVQAAGRLIRAPSHRGVLVLVDARYLQGAYRQFFPSLWQPRVTAAQDLACALAEFWEQNLGTEH